MPCTTPGQDRGQWLEIKLMLHFMILFRLILSIFSAWCCQVISLMLHMCRFIHYIFNIWRPSAPLKSGLIPRTLNKDLIIFKICCYSNICSLTCILIIKVLQHWHLLIKKLLYHMCWCNDNPMWKPGVYNIPLSSEVCVLITFKIKECFPFSPSDRI